MRIPDSVIEEIRQKTDIVEVVQDYVSLQRRGAKYWGLSPFKHEKTPSFSVDRDKGLYYCFSTQQGGTVFNFLMTVEGYNFPEAVEHLAERAGVEIPRSAEEKQHSTQELEILKRITESFRYILQNSEHAADAREYLSARGLSSDTIDAFRLGYAPASPNWMWSFLRKCHYSEKSIARSGLLARNSRAAFFRNRIVFPIADSAGKVVGFGGRALGETDIKYLNSREAPFFQKKRLLFGFPQAKDAIRKEKLVYLVEGYFDVLALHEISIANVLAPLGTALGEAQFSFLRGRVEKVVLVFDGDEAGQQAAFRAGKLAEQLEITVESASLPVGKDPADFIEEGKNDELRALLQNSEQFFPYIIRCYKEQYDIDKPDDMVLVSRKIFDYIRAVPLRTRRAKYLQQLADTLLLDRLAVEQDFHSSMTRGVTKLQSSRDHAEPPSVDISLIAVALRDVSLFEFLRENVEASDFVDQRAKDLYYQMEQVYREIFSDAEGEKLQFAERVLSRVEADSSRNLLIEQSLSDTKDSRAALEVGIRFIQQRTLRRRQKETEQEIRNMERIFSEKEQYKHLIEAKKDIDKKIDELQQTSQL